MAVYDLNNQYDVQKFRQKVQELLHRGGGVELKRVYAVRSNQQNRYLHLLLGFFASRRLPSGIKQCQIGLMRFFLLSLDTAYVLEGVNRQPDK